MFDSDLGEDSGLQYSRRFIAALTETTFKQCGTPIEYSRCATSRVVAKGVKECMRTPQEIIGKKRNSDSVYFSFLMRDHLLFSTWKGVGF